MQTKGLYWLAEDIALKERIREQTRSGSTQWDSLRTLAGLRHDFTTTATLDRLLRSFTSDNQPPNGTRQVRLALLGSATLDHLLAGIRVGCLRRNISLKTYVAAYGQYLQELSDPSSPLYAFAPDVLLFAPDARHLVAGLGPAATKAEADAFVDGAVNSCISIWKMAQAKLGCRVLQQIPLPILIPVHGQNEHRFPGSRVAALGRITQRLRVAADEHGVDLLALDAQAARDGLEAWHDPALWFKAKHEVSASAAPVFGDLVARLIAAQGGGSSKCLVLDLDNTLWGGVVGDDGLEGIVIGQGSTMGEAFLELQRYALDLSRRGIILAVCSKNDEANALLPFERHPDMILKRADIACFVANWEDKATNLRRIAQTLNIGLDSLVFVDDNPFERNIVRRELPMVAVPELPEDPSSFARCLADAGYFETTHLTAEDFARTEQYQTQTQRAGLQAAATDLEGYLAELHMELRWNEFDRLNLQRIVQLINKTNQFNLTTRRYSEEEILQLMRTSGVLTLQVRLEDRFGDNGMVGVVIGRPVEKSSLLIDTWLMSCRVLGRQVEDATLNLVMEKAAQMGVTTVIGEYRPTAKNEMVQDLFPRLGFTPYLGDDASRTLWSIPVQAYLPKPVPMQIVHSEELAHV